MKNLSDVHEIIQFEKKGTKSYDLLVEVVDHLKNELGYTIVDSFSDSGGKFSVLTKMKDPLPYKKYDLVCEFAVHKIRNIEYFIIWDRSDEQPYEKNKYSVIKEEQGFGFGRYEFRNRQLFYSYIKGNKYTLN